jgi:hypothetical protein
MKVTVELSHDNVAAVADALAARLKDAPKAAVETSLPAGFVSCTEATRIGVSIPDLFREFCRMASITPVGGFDAP